MLVRNMRFQEMAFVVISGQIFVLVLESPVSWNFMDNLNNQEELFAQVPQNVFAHFFRKQSPVVLAF